MALTIIIKQAHTPVRADEGGSVFSCIPAGVVTAGSPTLNEQNNAKHDTAAYDKLAKIKPMYLEMREACKAKFHPHQNISVDERMVGLQIPHWNKTL